MSDLTFSSEMGVNLIDSMGNDTRIAAAAKVSVSAEECLKLLEVEKAEGIDGLINYLMKQRHGSPFEHVVATFYLKVPIFVVREWMRHRMASYNEMSGRYTRMLPEFWIPDEDRKLFPIDYGYKASRPVLRSGTAEEHAWLVKDIKESAQEDWDHYQKRIDFGYVNEVSRTSLGVNIYTQLWSTANLRSWMNFLSLRTHNPDAMFVSYPMKEINDGADKVESFLNAIAPLAMAAFNKNGRVCP